MKVAGKGGFEPPDYLYKAGRSGKSEDAPAPGSPLEGKPEVKENPFAKKLEDATQKQSRQSLEALLGQIQEEGKHLAAHPTMAALEKFKELVKKFLDETVPGSYKLKVTRSSQSASQQKLYLVVEEVDAKMAELTQQIVSGQRDGLKLLATVDQVRGLLMDLYK